MGVSGFGVQDFQGADDVAERFLAFGLMMLPLGTAKRQEMDAGHDKMDVGNEHQRDAQTYLGCKMGVNPGSAGLSFLSRARLPDLAREVLGREARLPTGPDFHFRRLSALDRDACVHFATGGKCRNVSFP